MGDTENDTKFLLHICREICKLCVCASVYIHNTVIRMRADTFILKTSYCVDSYHVWVLTSSCSSYTSMCGFIIKTAPTSGLAFKLQHCESFWNIKHKTSVVDSRLMSCEVLLYQHKIHKWVQEGHVDLFSTGGSESSSGFTLAVSCTLVCCLTVCARGFAIFNCGVACLSNFIVLVEVCFTAFSWK